MPHPALLLLPHLLALPALLGEESFGNKPLPAQKHWPAGVQAAANDTHRVYTRWVNGNEDFVYRGDLAAVNAALQLFAAIGDADKEVILLPGVGETRSFKGKRVVYDWKLHVPSGIYLALAKMEQGTRVMSRHPQLTIHIKTALPAEKLQIPKGLTVIGPDDLLRRYQAGLKSSKITIRCMAVTSTATLPYLGGSLETVLQALGDDDADFRFVAASGLAKFGPAAKTALPKLRKLRDASHHLRRASYDEILRQITATKREDAPPLPIRAGEVARIRAVIEARRPAKPKPSTPKK